jgi:hypothetical protein
VIRRIVVLLGALAVLPNVAVAQESRVYVGGSVNAATQTHSDAEPLGGTALGGSVVFGVQVSRRVAVEFEPSFGEPYSWEYTYNPGPTRTAHVVASRRDSFYSFQVRTRLGVLEPVAGLSYVRGRIGRHATNPDGSTYFDDHGSDNGLALVAGLDAAVKVTSHAYFVPTFRVFARGFQNSGDDPLRAQTNTGLSVYRYGAGVRVTF